MPSPIVSTRQARNLATASSSRRSGRPILRPHTWSDAEPSNSRPLHRPVEVVFATRLGPDDIMLRNAIRRLRTAGAQRIALSPYFLSAGLLTERVETALDRLVSDAVVAGPIGTHPALVDAVADSYRSAVAHPPLAPVITQF